MIKIRNVTKAYKTTFRTNKIKSLFFPQYKTIKAVDNVSLKVKKGEIFGLLGPNGAGKTTLMKLICGLIQPTKGQTTIDGSSVKKKQRKIGLMLSNTMIYYRITGYDNLEYFAKLYGLKNYNQRIKNISGFLELDDFLHEYVETYSEGMKTKLALARALIHGPDILLLDEPTIGLDPHVSIQIRDKIKELKDRNKTIILTTHNIYEAEQLCDRVGILNKGKLISVNSPQKLKKLIKNKKANLTDVFIKLTGEEL